jgi:hypothetical protein
MLELTCNRETGRARADENDVGAILLNPCSLPISPSVFWAAKTSDGANKRQAITKQRQGGFLFTSPTGNTVQTRTWFIGLPHRLLNFMA